MYVLTLITRTRSSTFVNFNRTTSDRNRAEITDRVVTRSVPWVTNELRKREQTKERGKDIDEEKGAK